MSASFEKVLLDVGGGAWAMAAPGGLALLRDTAVLGAVAIRYILEAGGADSDSVPDLVDRLFDWSEFRLKLEDVETLLRERGLETEAVGATLQRIAAVNLPAGLRYCDGMDVVEVLAGATRRYRPRGIKPSQSVDCSSLIAMLRVSFELNSLEEDSLYPQMREWELTTRGQYPLLTPWRARDPLGVVADQRYWQRDVPLMLQMTGSEATLAAFKLDLDNFKSVNTALGHSGGDEALRLYCCAVRDALAGRGEVYRRGGDEVVAFVPRISEADARALGEAIRAKVEDSLAHWGAERGLSLTPTASIGVALTTGRASADEVVRLMDLAQQAAKEQGKNRVHVVVAE
jgi:diguanylate cyclase (GGDEF)-like protein